jgi:hypothetical protein
VHRKLVLIGGGGSSGVCGNHGMGRSACGGTSLRLKVLGLCCWFVLLVRAAGSCSWFVQLVRASHFIRGLVKTVQREFRKALHEIHRPRAPSEVSPFSASSGCMVCRVGLNRVWPYVR